MYANHEEQLRYRDRIPIPKDYRRDAEYTRVLSPHYTQDNSAERWGNGSSSMANLESNGVQLQEYERVVARERAAAYRGVDVGINQQNSPPTVCSIRRQEQSLPTIRKPGLADLQRAMLSGNAKVNNGYPAPSAVRRLSSYRPLSSKSDLGSSGTGEDVASRAVAAASEERIGSERRKLRQGSGIPAPSSRQYRALVTSASNPSSLQPVPPKAQDSSVGGRSPVDALDSYIMSNGSRPVMIRDDSRKKIEDRSEAQRNSPRVRRQRSNENHSHIESQSTVRRKESVAKSPSPLPPAASTPQPQSRGGGYAEQLARKVEARKLSAQQKPSGGRRRMVSPPPNLPAIDPLPQQSEEENGEHEEQGEWEGDVKVPLSPLQSPTRSDIQQNREHYQSTHSERGRGDQSPRENGRRAHRSQLVKGHSVHSDSMKPLSTPRQQQPKSLSRSPLSPTRAEVAATGATSIWEKGDEGVTRHERNEKHIHSEADLLLYSKKARPVQYVPHTLKEYRKLKPKSYYELGKLQPDLNTPELVRIRANAERVKDFSSKLTEINRTVASSAPLPQPPPPRGLSKRELALAFARERVPIPKTKPRLPSPTEIDNSGRSLAEPSFGRKEEKNRRAVTMLSSLEKEHDSMRKQVSDLRSQFGL